MNNFVRSLNIQVIKNILLFMHVHAMSCPCFFKLLYWRVPVISCSCPKSVVRGLWCCIIMLCIFFLLLGKYNFFIWWLYRHYSFILKLYMPFWRLIMIFRHMSIIRHPTIVLPFLLIMTAIPMQVSHLMESHIFFLHGLWAFFQIVKMSFLTQQRYSNFLSFSKWFIIFVISRWNSFLINLSRVFIIQHDLGIKIPKHTQVAFHFLCINK